MAGRVKSIGAAAAKKSSSRTSRAGLQFPVGQIARFLKADKYADFSAIRVSPKTLTLIKWPWIRHGCKSPRPPPPIPIAYVVSISGKSCSSADFCFFSGVSSGGTAYLRQDSSAPAAWRSCRWRKAVGYYSSIFQDLLVERFLTSSSKSLYAETLTGKEVLVLKEIGVSDSVGVSKKESPPLNVVGDLRHPPFANESFDFVFAGRSIDGSNRQYDLVSELSRVLCVGGFLEFLTVSVADSYSFGSLLDLLSRCRYVRSREINRLDSSNPINPIASLYYVAPATLPSFSSPRSSWSSRHSAPPPRSALPAAHNHGG